MHGESYPIRAPHLLYNHLPGSYGSRSLRTDPREWLYRCSRQEPKAPSSMPTIELNPIQCTEAPCDRHRSGAIVASTLGMHHPPMFAEGLDQEIDRSYEYFCPLRLTQERQLVT